MPKKLLKIDYIMYLLVLCSFFVLIFLYQISLAEHTQVVGPYWIKDNNEYNDLLVEKIKYHKQGLYSEISATNSAIYQDGHIMCSNSFNNRLHFYLQAIVPKLIHEDPQNAFVLGYGCGFTVKYLEELNIPNIITLELEPFMYEAATYLDGFEKVIKPTYAKIIIDDARNYLNLKNKTKFDLIVSDPPQQQLSYSTNIYSADFFEIVKKSLSENGSFSTWYYNTGLNDMKIMYKSLLSVFDSVLIIKITNTQYIFVATDVHIDDINIESFKNISLEIMGKDSDITSYENIGIYNCKNEIENEDIDINTDDNLKIEVSSGKDYYTKINESLLKKTPKYLEANCIKYI